MCFKCFGCQKSLVDLPFAAKNEKIYCADCHDNNFAARCDCCGEPFRGGGKFLLLLLLLIYSFLLLFCYYLKGGGGKRGEGSSYLSLSLKYDMNVSQTSRFWLSVSYSWKINILVVFKFLSSKIKMLGVFNFLPFRWHNMMGVGFVLFSFRIGKYA